jgi:acyl carrier protein
MEITQIISEVNEIFKTVMDNDDIVINENSTARDIDEWDSLTNIQLVVGVEKHFKIRFTSQEIQGFTNVGDMCRTIQAKLKA